MAQSPGHKKWHEHAVREVWLGGRLRVEANGTVLAESDEVVKVEEDEHPPRYYFPRSDVMMDKLERTETATRCPFKGTARYFRLRDGNRGGEGPEVAWTYERPYEEHRGLAGRVAFDQGAPEVSIISE